MKKSMSKVSKCFLIVILIALFHLIHSCTALDSGTSEGTQKQGKDAKSSESITVTPVRALVDTPLKIHAAGFAPGQKITIRARAIDAKGRTWESQAVYKTGSDGNVDLNTQEPVSGPYKNADPMGLIWSMLPRNKDLQQTFFILPNDLSSIKITFEVLKKGKVVANSQVECLQIADGVKRVVVRENGLFGTLFLPPGDGPHPAITRVGGASGGLSEFAAALYASHGYACFALAYFRYQALPNDLAEIPLEYFEKSIQYLQSLDSIDNDRLAIIGSSRGGELALLLGSTFPQYKAVIANVPSNILWAGYDYFDGLVSAWVYKGKAFPYIVNSNYFYLAKRGEAISRTPGFLKTMQSFPQKAKKAEIPVEKINGDILMISGEDDQMWPSTQFANMAMDRLKAHNFKKPFFHFSYKDAGHMIVIPYYPTNVTAIIHPVTGGFYALGGTPEANYIAGVDSWRRKLEFLKKHL